MSEAPNHVILLGPPGSGKGTQAERLADRLGAEHVNTGASLRELAAEDSPLGRRVAELTGRGDLVPDDVTDQVVRARLESIPAGRGFILDGYPRTVAQAEALRGLLAELGRLEPRPVFVRLDVPRDTVLERLRRRRGLEQRADDTDARAVRRLEIYDAETAPSSALRRPER
jgi:adenylate kinase